MTGRDSERERLWVICEWQKRAVSSSPNFSWTAYAFALHNAVAMVTVAFNSFATDGIVGNT